jgi:hypothetical protein
MSHSERDDGETPRIRLRHCEGTVPLLRGTDLDAMTTEAMLEQAMRADAQRKGVPRKHYDPDWQPKHEKGQPLDKDSGEYRVASEAAVKGLPPVNSLTWMEVQCFDNGPGTGKHAHTQFVLKLTGTTAAAGALMTEDKRSLSTTRHCYLSTPKNFVRNLKRKKAQHALSAEEWTLVTAMMEEIEDRPDALIGALSCKFHGEGTVRSNGQFASVTWKDGFPVMTLYQHFHRTGEVDGIRLALGTPPNIKAGRKPTACKWYGKKYSEDFKKLLDADPQQALREKMAKWKKAA